MAACAGRRAREMLLRRLDDDAPAAFDALVVRRLRAGAGRLYHRPHAPSGRSSWRSAPARSIPRADSETLIEAAVAHFGAAGPRRILDLGTGPGTLAARRARSMAGGDAGSASTLPKRRWPMRAPQRRFPRAEFRLGDWGEGWTSASTSSSATRLMSKPARRCRPTSPTGSPPAPSMPARTGSTPIARSRRSFARLLAPGGDRLLRNRRRAGKRGRGALRAEGFTIESRNDLRGIARCLVVTA